MLAPDVDDSDEDEKPARGPVKADGKPKPAERQAAEDKPRGRTPRAEKELAYAKPEKSFFEGLFGGGGVESGAWPGRGTRVAIYDISGATVYMPDGTRLEAHSGIGEMRDNPKYTHVKMRGRRRPACSV